MWHLVVLQNKSETTNATSNVSVDGLNWNKQPVWAVGRFLICQQPPRWAQKQSASTRKWPVYTREQSPPGWLLWKPTPSTLMLNQTATQSSGGRALWLGFLRFNQPSDSSSPGCHHHPGKASSTLTFCCSQFLGYFV